MYSRRLGIYPETKQENNVEKFNENLREQYNQKRRTTALSTEKNPVNASLLPIQNESKEDSENGIDKILNSAKNFVSNLNLNVDFETLLILGLIVLILTDTDIPDLVLLGILIAVIL